ncbi:MAG: putative lipid II flippase FtsW [Candidatus Spechtbacteria bacterium]|nr:putative lipid II flippase FtsW [Candidatus Spechtbacteria bacterium]
MSIAALFSVGLVILSSASGGESQYVFGNIYGYLQHQLIYGVGLGLIGGFIFYFLPYKILHSLALPFYLTSLFLLILIFVPGFAYAAGGAQRWIHIGSFLMQPSEITKLTFVIYLAAWFASKKNEVQNIGTGLVPFTILVGMLAFFLFLQPDISTLILIGLTAGFMYIVAGGKIQHFAFLGVLGVIGLFILIQIAPYRLERISTFLNPQTDPMGISYHLNQALLAEGSGGLWGVGIAQGQQSHNFLPEPMGDSIFAVWSEETGFVGAISLILLFLIFIWRGLKIARDSNDRFSSMLALGITSWIGIQAFINIGSITGVLPLMGIPLPFISYGGSAMVSTLAASGLLLQISRHN